MSVGAGLVLVGLVEVVPDLLVGVFALEPVQGIALVVQLDLLAGVVGHFDVEVDVALGFLDVQAVIFSHVLVAAGGDLHCPGDGQGQAAAVFIGESDEVVRPYSASNLVQPPRRLVDASASRAYAGAPHKVSAGDLARHRCPPSLFLYTGFAAYFSSWFDSITAGGWMSIKPRIFHLLRPFFKAAGPARIVKPPHSLHLSTRKNSLLFCAFPLRPAAPRFHYNKHSILRASSDYSRKEESFHEISGLNLPAHCTMLDESELPESTAAAASSPSSSTCSAASPSTLAGAPTTTATTPPSPPAVPAGAGAQHQPFQRRYSHSGGYGGWDASFNLGSFFNALLRLFI